MEYQIVIASTNSGKIAEISSIFNSISGLKVKVKSLKDYNIKEPNEPYETFMENAIHKAKYYAKYTQLPTLSEDSGLCIEALNGLPGVRSKDFIEECGGASNAFVKLQESLSGISNKSAYFNSAAVLYIPDQDILISHEAKDYGSICFPPRGEHGFAYDPIFVPRGQDKTFGELELEQKNKTSHRKKAMMGVIEKIQEYLKPLPA